MNRVFFVNRFFWPDESATSQILTDVVFELAEKGYEVAVISSRQLFGDAGANLPAKETVNAAQIYRVWTSRWGRANLFGRAIDYLTFYCTTTFWLFRLVAKGDIVVAKTDPPMLSVLAFLVTRVKSAFLINWYQDIYPEIAERLGVRGVSSVAPILRRMRDHVARKSHSNAVIGRCMATMLAKRGVPESHIHVIPNWVDDEAIVPMPRESNPLRKEWGLTSELVVGYSGNIGRGHDFEALLEAMEGLKSRADIKFLFIGEGARLKSLQEESTRRKLRNVIFKPFQPRENLPISLTVSDIHVVTLQHGLEGLLVPSKFYGALAAGRPVLFLGSALSEVARVVAEERCGFVVDNGSSEIIASRIVELRDSPELLSKMSDNGRRAIDEKYGQSRALQKWRAVIEESLKRR